MSQMRLQKYLAASGVASRRQSEIYIANGRVSVNGRVVTKMGIQVDPQKDNVVVDGHPVTLTSTLVYYALNKPKGFTTTASDPHAKHTVLELVPPNPRVYPVGRLDLDTEGLLILTNDGELTYELTHPKFAHEKEYLVLASYPGEQTRQHTLTALHRLESGVKIDRASTSPAKISHVQFFPNKSQIKFHLTIHEGRKHQVKLMVDAAGLKVSALTRVRFGKLRLGNIPRGKYITIKKSDIM